MRHRSRWLAGFTAALVLLTPAASIAQEATSTTRPARPQPTDRPTKPHPDRPSKPPADEQRKAQAMDEVKSRCLRQIDLRHTALARVKQRISSARFLTDAHEAALVQNIDAIAASLSRLADVIQGEDDFEELRVECRSIVMDHRVFVLVLPRARLVTAADAELAAVARLREAADRLQARIDATKSEGDDTAEAESDLARMRAHVATAEDQVAGLYDSVIGISPAQYNLNHQILDGPRRAVRAARNELRAAVAAARQARQGLGQDSGQSA